MKSRIALLAAMSLAAGSAMAQTSNPGFYVGGGVGQANIEDDVYGLEAGDLAWQLFTGYRLFPYLSVELSYLDGGSPEDTIGNVSVTAETTGFQLALFPTLPISETFAIFGRLGYFAWEQTISASAGGLSASLEDDGNEFVWGAGLLFTNDQYGFRVDYQQADVEETTYSAIMGSISVGF